MNQKSQREVDTRFEKTEEGESSSNISHPPNSADNILQRCCSQESIFQMRAQSEGERSTKGFHIIPEKYVIDSQSLDTS